MTERLLGDYPDESGIGIDARVARELKDLILDPEVVIPPSGRTRNENLGYWDYDRLLEASKWLRNLLEIGTEGKVQRIKNEHINKASKLGLIPSRPTFNANALPVGKINRELRLAGGEKYDYRYWSTKKIIEEGSAIAKKDGRFSVKKLNGLNSQGKFLGLGQLELRFGNLSSFNEAVGWPSFYGASPEDYLDWGAAVKRQNGISIRILRDMVEYYSLLQHGPSWKSIYKHFKGIGSFDFEVDQKLEEEQEQEKLAVEGERRYLDRYIPIDPLLSEVVRGLEDEELLRVAANYRLVRSFTPEMPVRGAKTTTRNYVLGAPLKGTADEVARWIISKSEHYDMAAVEYEAERLGIFDRLWPMRRFENVDLKLPEDWREQLAAKKAERKAKRQTRQPA